MVFPAEVAEDYLLELVQEANTALVDSVLTFNGASAREFKRHVTASVEQRLAAWKLPKDK